MNMQALHFSRRTGGSSAAVTLRFQPAPVNGGGIGAGRFIEWLDVAGGKFCD
jgi:hypothetical protein